MAVFRVEEAKESLTRRDSLCLKGVAIVLMLFHHCFMSEDRFEGFTIDFSPFSQEAVVAMSFAGKVCVPIFLFITGFGLAISIARVRDDGVNQWMKKRLCKLLCGYCFIHALSFIITLSIDQRPVNTYLVDGVEKGFFYWIFDLFGLASLFDTPTLNGTWWYMSIAVVSILCIPLIRLTEEKAGCVALLLLSFFARRVITPEAEGTKDFLFWLPALSLGYVFATQNVFARITAFLERHLVRRILYYVVIVAAVCFFAAGKSFFWIRLPLFALAVILLCKDTLCRIKYLSDILVFLGRYSMDIFLTHTFIRHYYLRDFTYSFGHFSLIVLVLLLDSLALAMAIGLLKRLVRFDEVVKRLMDRL